MTATRRLVVFDVDGTLIDSQRHIHAAMTQAFAAIAREPPPLADILAIVGLSLPEAMARLAPEVDGDGRAALVAAYKDSFADHRAARLAPPYPGAIEALARLAARDDILLGIATGKSRRGLDQVIRAYGLEGRFATAQVADDHPSKPHPSMLRAALAETGVAAADAVMIGDTTYDIDMGRAAGCATIGVAWGYHTAASLAAAGADRVVAAFDEIDTAIAELGAAR